MCLKKLYIVTVFLALFILKPAISYSQSGAGIFIIANCGNITNPQVGNTWCLNYNNGTPFIDVYGSSGFIGAASVTSVAINMSAVSELSVSGSPITNNGTFTFTKANQSANTVWAGPTTGSATPPSFRVLVSADLTAALTSPPTIGGTTPGNAFFNNITINGTCTGTGCGGGGGSGSPFATLGLTPQTINTSCSGNLTLPTSSNIQVTQTCSQTQILPACSVQDQILIIWEIENSTGGYTPTLQGPGGLSITWQLGGLAPTPNTTANLKDMYSFICDSTLGTWQQDGFVPAHAVAAAAAGSNGQPQYNNLGSLGGYAIIPYAYGGTGVVGSAPCAPYHDTVTLSGGTATYTNSCVTTHSFITCAEANPCTVGTISSGSVGITGTGSDVVQLLIQ